jgi:hypothetical protein
LRCFKVVVLESTESHESTDRIRRAQGLALAFVPVLTDFKAKQMVATLQANQKAEPNDDNNVPLGTLFAIAASANGLT